MVASDLKGNSSDFLGYSMVFKDVKVGFIPTLAFQLLLGKTILDYTVYH